MARLRRMAVGVVFGVLFGAAPVAADPASSWQHVLRPDVAAPPWARRIPPTPSRPWAGYSALRSWPEEPSSPPRVSVLRFADALGWLCGNLGEAQAQRYARWMIASGRRHDMDPFLIAAVIRVGSGCAPDHDDYLGSGLGRIPHRVHSRHVRDGRLSFHVLEGETWRALKLPLDSFAFTQRTLLGAEASIYFVAALLQMNRRQCSSIDHAVSGERHRHFSSHYLWADRVLGTRFEEQVLQERRRLLQLYDGRRTESLISFRGVALNSPLDGTPRQVSSSFRAPRPNGRRHRGLDLVSTYGEPVRAVADGVVVFAGIAHPRWGVSSLGPAAARRVPRAAMGIGGLFLLVRHQGRLTSGYFHLSSYTVRQGDRVQAGQIIGAVGDTGVKESPPHLHFELRVGDHKIDPLRGLRPYLVPREPPPRARQNTV